MTEVLRLIGLSQDGSLMPIIMVGVGVWAITSIKHLRSDMAAMNIALLADHQRLETRMDRLESALGKVAADVADLRADVAFLRGRAERDA